MKSPEETLDQARTTTSSDSHDDPGARISAPQSTAGSSVHRRQAVVDFSSIPGTEGSGDALEAQAVRRKVVFYRLRRDD